MSRLDSLFNSPPSILTHSRQHTDTREKERMILMQQKKIAALDEANARLIKELSRLGDKLERTTKLAAVARQASSCIVLAL